VHGYIFATINCSSAPGNFLNKHISKSRLATIAVIQEKEQFGVCGGEGEQKFARIFYHLPKYHGVKIQIPRKKL